MSPCWREVEGGGGYCELLDRSFASEEHAQHAETGEMRHLLLAEKLEASTDAVPGSDSDQSYRKGRPESKKTPCQKHKSSLPGHVDGFPAEDLGRAPETSHRATTASVTTSSVSQTPATTTTHSTSTTPPDDAEPEADLPYEAVPGEPDPEIDAAADGLPPPSTSTVPKPPQVHEDAGEW